MIDLDRLQKTAGIVGNSDAIKQALEMMAQVSTVDISVLITGESGTGKEMVAKGLHKFSKRSQSELVTVNCGAIPEGIIESELFGHKKAHSPVLVMTVKDISKQRTKEQSFWMR